MKKYRLVALSLIICIMFTSFPFIRTTMAETLKSNPEINAEMELEEVATSSIAEKSEEEEDSNYYQVATPTNVEKEDNGAEEEEKFENQSVIINSATPSTATRSNAMPPFFYEKTVAGYKITLKAEAGILPEDTKVKIKKVDEVDAVSIADILEDEFSRETNIEKIVSFDIAFFVEGEEIQPSDGAVQVSINMKKDIAKYPGALAKVFHIVQENMVEEIESKSDAEGNISYDATTFSVYSMVLSDAEDYIPIYTIADLRNIEIGEYFTP